MFRSENRLENNLKIVELIKKLCLDNPNLRFWQLLSGSGVIQFDPNTDEPVVLDNFYEESSVTLSKIKNSMLGRRSGFLKI